MFTFDKLMERIKEKESKLILTLKEIKMETSPSGVDERIHHFNIWMKNFHQRRSMPNIIQEVIKKLSFEKTPAVRTELKWFNDFKSNNYQGLSLHYRGYYKRERLISNITFGEYTLASKLKLFIRFEKNVTLDKCTEWIRELLKTLPLDHPSRNWSPSRCYMYRWLHDLGAIYTERKKTYYTDKHESTETKEYRSNIYIPEHYKLSLRQPVWASVLVDDVQSEAIYLEHC
jgi:hypothetical protein